MSIKQTPITIFAIGMVIIALARPSLALDYDSLDKYLYPEPEKKISMNFSGATLENVLKVFSQQSGLNFIAATDITTKTINLYLDNVPVEEALEKILSANNLTYEINPGSNIFVVKQQQETPQQLMTRIYPLKFATVPSSRLLNTLTDAEPVSSEGNGIVSAIEALLTRDGSVIEDTRTNSLIVTDIPSLFPLIESTITRLDIRIPQILIEAEILDIAKTLADDLGPKFGGDGNAFIDFSPASRNTGIPFNQNDLIRNGDFTKSFTEGTIEFPALNVTVDFLRTHNDTKNLARPRILTLNNNTAEISIVTDEAIGLSSNTTTAEGTADTVLEAERVETGVSLKVTPQANVTTREITMAIEPKVVDVSPGGTFGGQRFNDPEERGTKSILRVNDGDTIVLGGLLRTDKTKIRTSVPVIGQIPFLGAAFRHKDLDEDERELIIFITPHIVEENIPLKTASRRTKSMDREQTKPSNRSLEIEKELLHLEKKFSSPIK